MLQFTILKVIVVYGNKVLWYLSLWLYNCSLINRKKMKYGTD